MTVRDKPTEEFLEIAIDVQLVGIKNLKSTHTWRLEFDVDTRDESKVKDLFDIIDQSCVIGIVERKKDLGFKKAI